MFPVVRPIVHGVMMFAGIATVRGLQSRTVPGVVRVLEVVHKQVTMLETSKQQLASVPHGATPSLVYPRGKISVIHWRVKLTPLL